MTVAEHIVSVAYDRARYSLADDSRATMLAILVGRSETDDLARWALNHDDAAVLRERWARDLATEAKNATEPIWKNLQGDHVDIDTLWEIFSATDDNGRSWAVSTVLASPVLTDEIRAAVWKLIEDETTSRKADESLRISIENLITVPWEWLGGWNDNPIEDDGSPIPDGFEVVARFDNMHVLRPSEPPRYLRAFARALWDGRWRNEAAERFRRTSRTLALTTRTTSVAVAILSPATTVQRREGEINLVSEGRTVGLVRDDDLLAMLTTWQGPLVDTGIARASASRIVENGRTAAGIAGFFHALKTVTALYREDKDLRAEWPSWLAWAEEVADHAEQRLDPHLRSLLYDFAWYGNSVQLRLWDDRWARGLWTLTAPDPYKRGRPPAGSSRGVAFRYADILDPGWARRENPTDRGRGVHLLALPERLTSYVRDPSQKGPAQLYSLLILAEVCDQSKHDQVDDGATISPIIRRMLTEKAGLHRDQEPIQLRGLLDNGLLVEVGPDRFALGMSEAKKMRAYVRPQPRRNTKKQ
jgi:hypothetical protein